MREVGVLEAKTKLSALLDEVEKGGEGVVITRHGRAVARLAPISPTYAAKQDFHESVLAAREAIAARWQGDEPFDWKAAVEEGRE